jgi:hypothetical protein
MKTKFTNRILVLSFVMAGFFLFPAKSFAQKKTDDQEKGKKTITIHVTKEVDGNVMIIDTTIVTDGDFDTDAFLAKNGITDGSADKSKSVEKKIVILNQGSEDIEWSESSGKLPDTIKLDKSEIMVFSEGFDFETPSAPGMEGEPLHYYKFKSHGGMPDLNEFQVEKMIEGMARSCGLGDVMPFGEMKQVVIKKKRNGKKMIITFEDRNEADIEREHAQKEKIIILKESDGNEAQVEKHVIIKGNPGEKIIIQEDKNTETKEVKVTVDVDTDKSAPEKTEKKVIIIKEEKK